MQREATSPAEYIEQIPVQQREAFVVLRDIIKQNLPSGFNEEMSYGMIGFVVPHSIYPNGYHCDPKLPLPFISIAAQKNFIAFYHMGIYGSPELLHWFVSEYPKYSKLKPDMGKSCIRFKNYNQIPISLISELVRKISVQDWISNYEMNLKKD